MKTNRVIIADDHPIIRSGIRNELREIGIEVVGEAANGDEVLSVVAACHPNTLILDIELPGKSGLDIARELRNTNPEINIILLTAHNQEGYIFGALKLGIKGYVLKEEALETILMAVNAAAEGGTWLSPKVAEKVVKRVVQGDAKSSAAITPQEIQVLRLLAQGKSDLEITKELGVSERTIRYYLRNIYDKADVTNRVQAVTWAIQQGIVQGE